MDRSNLREQMRGVRWILIRKEDFPDATGVWMYAELDGSLVALDHRGTPFRGGVHNRAIHLILTDANDDSDCTGITKVVHEGELEDHLW